MAEQSAVHIGGRVRIGDRVLICERSHLCRGLIGEVDGIVRLKILGEDAGPHAEVRIEGFIGVTVGVPLGGLAVLKDA
jgi:hypothetical protein